MISIRIKILIIALSSFIITAGAFIIYSIFVTENYKQMRLKNIKETIEFETEKVNKIIAQIELSAKHFALVGHLCFEAQSKKLGENLIIEFLNSFPTAIGGGFWFAPYAFDKNMLRAGFYAFYDHNINTVRLDPTFFSPEYDYHNSSWYREITQYVTEKNQVVWTKPYIDGSGSYSLMTTAGAGIFDEEGNLIAISTIDWEVEEVINTLSAITPTSGSFVVLYDPIKDYIISNTGLALEVESDTSLTREHAPLLKDIQDIAKDIQDITRGCNPLLINNIPWDLDTEEFTLCGVDYIRFKRVMDNDWYLSVIVPADEIFERIEKHNINFSITMTVIFVIMLVSIFYFISKLINLPLQKLTSGVSEFGFGNFDVNIAIKSNDELGLLSRTFNKMAVDLKAAIEQNTRENIAKEKIAAELRVASQIQMSMLSTDFPICDEFEIYATMLPAKQIGGDFYDFFMIDDNTLAVIIADVSGKGIPAALFMATAKRFIKNNAQYEAKSPSDVFYLVNNKLCKNNDASMFVTVFMGYLDIPSGRFTFVNAGHNPPLWCSDGIFAPLQMKRSFVLGGIEDIVYEQGEIILGIGDTLFLYTDGITEAMNSSDVLFGETRLLSSINASIGMPIKDLTESIKSSIDDFVKDAEQADDIAMLVLRYGKIIKN